MAKTVLVTGIGGNVGQGILRCIRQLPDELEIIGVNIDVISPGNYLCDHVYKVPYAYDDGYVDKMMQICHQHEVDLVIPSTDYEVYYLAKEADKLPQLSSNPEASAKIFLDKYLTWQFFQQQTIPFASSCLPSEFKGQYEHYIVKPRAGRGSRGLNFNPVSLGEFSDEEYMVQELHKGKELTSAFYIDKKQKVHGPFTMERWLENGTTVKCIVNGEFNTQFRAIMEQIAAATPIKGSCNIQAIVDEGRVQPFEINGRVSGTNSIRAQLGFPDVKFAIDEYLYARDIEVGPAKKGGAMRILLDVVYPEATELAHLQDPNAKHLVF